MAFEERIDELSKSKEETRHQVDALNEHVVSTPSQVFLSEATNRIKKLDRHILALPSTKVIPNAIHKPMKTANDFSNSLYTQMSEFIIQSNESYNDFSHRMEIISNDQMSEPRNSVKESISTMLKSETSVRMVSCSIIKSLGNYHLYSPVGNVIVSNVQENSQLHNLISSMVQHNVGKKSENILILNNTNTSAIIQISKESKTV